MNGANKYLIQVAEKGVYWTKIRIKGAPGHASIPTVGDNALVSMAAVIEKLGKHRTPIKI
ncbi:MAG: peptidase dimerization domain-containing protein, partial [Candidatus Aenigmarchaeota archaeon]|nr:peptidase dimerization domain-containing protein [Candidatus Aenigmarchaeota archaeon]